MKEGENDAEDEENESEEGTEDEIELIEEKNNSEDDDLININEDKFLFHFGENRM